MNHVQPWEWMSLLLLGAWHGVNPGMGWPFAVTAGLQKQSGSAVWLSLLPIAAGHLFAIGLVAVVAVLAGTVIPLWYAKICVAALLFAFGLYRLRAKSHPHWGGARVGFRELAFWSFLMASVHGAGLMLLPILLGMSALGTDHEMHVHMTVFLNLQDGLIAVAIHTFGYLLFMGATAWVVYRGLGAVILQKAWFNLDLVWGWALIATAGLTLLLSPG